MYTTTAACTAIPVYTTTSERLCELQVLIQNHVCACVLQHLCTPVPVVYYNINHLGLSNPHRFHAKLRNVQYLSARFPVVCLNELHYSSAVAQDTFLMFSQFAAIAPNVVFMFLSPWLPAKRFLCFIFSFYILIFRV